MTVLESRALAAKRKVDKAWDAYLDSMGDATEIQRLRDIYRRAELAFVRAALRRDVAAERARA